MPLQALRHIADVGTGDTRPQVFVCDHGGVRELWVLKLMGLSVGELAADWIGSRLAQRVGVRCPPVEIAPVTPAVLLDAPAELRAWARPGPAFASRLIEPVRAGLTDADLASVPAADLGKMYALDAWLEVLDRRKPDGIWNALKDESDGSLVVLDFGKSLSPCLQFVIGGGDDLIEPAYPAAVLAAADINAALDLCATIESVSQTEVERIVAEMPADWASDATRLRIVRFLVERAGRIRELCHRSLGERRDRAE